MGRIPVGFTSAQWNALSREERDAIIKENRKAYNRKYQKENAERVRKHSLNTYYKYKPEYDKRIKEYRQDKKAEYNELKSMINVQHKLLDDMEEELEKYKTLAQQLEQKLAQV